MQRRSGVVAVLAAAGLVLAGCGGGSSTPSAAPPPSPTVSPCPSVSTPAHTNWPADVPRDLPKPDHAQIQQSQLTTAGVRILKFQTSTSLREGVLFIVNKLPKAGWVLGRGDAEANEADAPFVHGETRGLYRLLALEPCKTLWLLATVNVSATTGGSPLLPTRSPSGSPSPLPFG